MRTITIKAWKTTIGLPADKYDAAAEIGRGRHRRNASDTRGAGTNEKYHILGSVGEQAVLYFCGIDRVPELCRGVSLSCDIPETMPPLEVKTGLPLEKRWGIKPAACYIVVEYFGVDFWAVHHFGVRRIAFGLDIQQMALPPPKQMCPRDGSANSNWEIPAALPEIEVIVP